MRFVNFIPIEHRRRHATRRQMVRWLTVAGAYGVVIVIAAVLGRLFAADTASALSSQLSSVEQAKSELHELSLQIHEQMQLTADRLEASRVIENRPRWDQLLALLAREGNGSVVLESCRIEMRIDDEDDRPPAIMVTARGVSQTHDEASAFVLRLEALGLFDSVRMHDAHREPFGDGYATVFSVDCHLTVPEAGGA